MCRLNLPYGRFKRQNAICQPYKLARFGSPRPSAAWTSFNRTDKLDVELYYTIMSTVYDGSSVLPEAAAPIPAIGTDADAHTVNIDKLLDAYA